MLAGDPQAAGEIVRDAFRGKTIIPKGTADVVLARLFPETRSKVPTDEGRRAAVYYILLETGAFTLGQSDDIPGNDDAPEGDSGQRGPDDTGSQVLSSG